MKLPRVVTFNQLNGLEGLDILCDRTRAVLEQCPQFQHHLTLPNVRLEMSLKMTFYADQLGSEPIVIEDDFTIDASPGPAAGGNLPPDAIRHQHGLPIPTPVRSETGHIVDDLGESRRVDDRQRQPEPDPAPEEEVQQFNVVRTADGQTVAPSGHNVMPHATTIVQDRGKALARGGTDFARPSTPTGQDKEVVKPIIHKATR